ncbi:MAG: apiosidase-like domain-containing protein [Anaerolineae bacterium]
MLFATQNVVTEWSFTSALPYADPFNEVGLDVLVTDPASGTLRLPAFWAGDNTWRVRFAAAMPGRHTWRSVCSDVDNAGLHGQEGEIRVSAYTGDNPLLRHGRLRVTANNCYLEHADGTPFLWLGDTWWMALCQRLGWPDDFRELAADRAAKGFSVIQVVAGLYPDMEPFDERGANEAGYAWERDWSRINPAYFDAADLRMAHLVQMGLVPCIVGEWGYYLEYAGAEVIRKHWRYLVARYGAYPVVWCAAGEALMPYYLMPEAEKNDPERAPRMRAAWSEIVQHIRAVDPFDNPITIHPNTYGHEQVDDPSLLDLDMLQTGHSGYPTLSRTVDLLEESLAHEPRLPVLVGEVNYEGIMESSREEMQRFLFWACMLSGAAGHTYGANGIWQVNTREKPYGVSPHGTAWGNLPWQDAYRLPGSRQLGMARKLLERHSWQHFRPYPEWVDPHQGPGQRIAAYAAGLPERVRVLYIPAETSWVAWRGDLRIKALEPDLSYHACYWDPKTGATYDQGEVTGDANGDYILPKPPIFQDWVFVLER